MGKSKEELELENKILRELLMKQTKQSQKSTSAPKMKPTKKKKVLYQCRYCGQKSIRDATDGAPSNVAKCPNHPKGWCKGVHSWQRTFL